MFDVFIYNQNGSAEKWWIDILERSAFHMNTHGLIPKDMGEKLESLPSFPNVVSSSSFDWKSQAVTLSPSWDIILSLTITLYTFQTFLTFSLPPLSICPKLFNFLLDSFDLIKTRPNHPNKHIIIVVLVCWVDGSDTGFQYLRWNHNLTK